MSKENVQKVTEFVIGKQVADWLDKELPGAITKAMQNVGSLTWRSSYEPGVSYSPGDMVRHNGSLWVALTSTAEYPTTQAVGWDYML